jgi:hypothetical protein
MNPAVLLLLFVCCVALFYILIAIQQNLILLSFSFREGRYISFLINIIPITSSSIFCLSYFDNSSINQNLRKASLHAYRQGLCADGLLLKEKAGMRPSAAKIILLR